MYLIGLIIITIFIFDRIKHAVTSENEFLAISIILMIIYVINLLSLPGLVKIYIYRNLDENDDIEIYREISKDEEV